MPFETIPSVGTGADSKSREASGQSRKFASYGRNRRCSGRQKAITETFDNGIFGDHSHEVPIVHSILDRNRKTEAKSNQQQTTISILERGTSSLPILPSGPPRRPSYR